MVAKILISINRLPESEISYMKFTVIGDQGAVLQPTLSLARGDIHKNGGESTMKSAAYTLAASFVLGVSSLAVTQQSFAGGSPPEPVSYEVLVDKDSPYNSCGFDMIWAVTGKAGTNLLPGDRIIYTSPGTTVDVTKLDDDGNPVKTVTLVATGVFHVSEEPNGDVVYVVTGRNLLGDPDAGTVLAIGKWRFSFDSEGNLIEPLNGVGRLVDVCALLD